MSAARTGAPSPSSAARSAAARRRVSAAGMAGRCRRGRPAGGAPRSPAARGRSARRGSSRAGCSRGPGRRRRRRRSGARRRDARARRAARRHRGHRWARPTWSAAQGHRGRLRVAHDLDAARAHPLEVVGERRAADSPATKRRPAATWRASRQPLAPPPMTGPVEDHGRAGRCRGRDLARDDLGARRDDELARRSPAARRAGSEGCRSCPGRRRRRGSRLHRACGASARAPPAVDAGRRGARSRRRAEAQLPDVLHRLEDDVVGHLRLADLAVDEDDRQLDDA